jgi:hypothetical protein
MSTRFDCLEPDDSSGSPHNELELDLFAQLRCAIDPEEDVVWAERAMSPPRPTIAVFPAFFTAVLCSLSGYTLMVLFGIHGLVELQPLQLLLYIGLAPAALAAVVLFGWIGRWVDFRRSRWRLAHTFYALTHRRALVGMEAGADGAIALDSFDSDVFDDTLCIEHSGGGGDVFFVKDGEVVSPELGFVGLARPRRIEDMLRMTLLGKESRSDRSPWEDEPWR